MIAATALLTNWQRRSNLIDVIESLRGQSVEVEIFLWDNSGIGGMDGLVDVEIVCGVNLMCHPRWFLASYARAPYVFSLDDDLALRDRDGIAKAIEAIEAGANAVGKEGVILGAERSYTNGRHFSATSAADRAVDIIKGRFFFTRKDTAIGAFRLAPASATAPRVEDDIIMSAGIRGQKILPRSLSHSFRELPPGPDSLCRDADHAESRQTEANLHEWS